MARLIRELAVAARSRQGTAFRNLPEYRQLIEGAYACGFVRPNVAPLAEYFQPYVDAPERLRAADFPTLRRFLYTMIRSERAADAGDDVGGGAIYHALRSGALEAVAARLEHARREDRATVARVGARGRERVRSLPDPPRDPGGC